MENQTQPVKTDRRAMRSKRLIMEALRELALEKDYKEISVSDIVKRADIGRATFYAHFEDKNHLGRFLFTRLQMQIEQEIQTILNESNGQNKRYQELVPSLALFRIAQDKHRWFKMNATNPEIGLGMLVPPLIQRLENSLGSVDRPKDDAGVPLNTTANFLISGLIALLSEWIITDMPKTPEEMDAIYQALARPTLAQLLGQ